MRAEVRAALERYLLAMADDELVIGYRDTEWTGAAPTLEEDVALSSIGQDEVGHARLLFILLHELTGVDLDYRARQPREYRHAQFLERPHAPRYDPAGSHVGGSDWADTIVRQYLYDLFDAERLSALRGSTWAPLALAIDKVQREEKYHHQHGQLWLDRLAAAGREARPRLEEALLRAWPDALGLFEPIHGEGLLVTDGAVGAGSAALRERWLDRLSSAFQHHALPLPARKTPDGRWVLIVEPKVGGRQQQHTAVWQQMWEEITSVYRLDPQATW